MSVFRTNEKVLAEVRCSELTSPTTALNWSLTRSCVVSAAKQSIA